MFTSQPTAFFSSSQSTKTKSGISFAYNVAKCAADVTTLYRGFSEVSTLMFQLPTMLLGIFGRNIPDQFTFENIHQHKIVNSASKYYFLAMAKIPGIAATRGDASYITIDPTLFRDFIADVDQTYSNYTMTMPGRMANEFEEVAIGVLYCCIKNFVIGNQTIANPFHLSISTDNKEAIAEFAALYTNYIDLLRAQYQETSITSKIREDTQTFVNNYLAFYEKYAPQNPFNLSLKKLQKLYPVFMAPFVKENTALLNKTTPTLFHEDVNLAMIINKISKDVFDQHAYTKDRKEVEKMQNATVLNYHEDEYSRPQYD